MPRHVVLTLPVSPVCDVRRPLTAFFDADHIRRLPACAVDRERAVLEPAVLEPTGTVGPIVGRVSRYPETLCQDAVETAFVLEEIRLRIQEPGALANEVLHVRLLGNAVTDHAPELPDDLDTSAYGLCDRDGL